MRKLGFTFGFALCFAVALLLPLIVGCSTFTRTRQPNQRNHNQSASQRHPEPPARATRVSSSSSQTETGGYDTPVVRHVVAPRHSPSSGYDTPIGARTATVAAGNDEDVSVPEVDEEGVDVGFLIDTGVRFEGGGIPGKAKWVLNVGLHGGYYLMEEFAIEAAFRVGLHLGSAEDDFSSWITPAFTLAADVGPTGRFRGATLHAGFGLAYGVFKRFDFGSVDTELGWLLALRLGYRVYGLSFELRKTGPVTSRYLTLSFWF